MLHLANGSMIRIEDLLLCILSFISPDDNFMFKSTEARAFANGCEFGEDIGSGQTFRLDVYYRMCRELAEEIKKNEKLCALLEDKLQAEANVDENETNLNHRGCWPLQYLCV